MPSIALFPTLFTQDEEVTKLLVQELSLTLYSDQELIAETAERHQIAPTLLEKALFQKSSVFNQFTLEKEKHSNLLQETLLDKVADNNNYLFYGLHALLIPLSISEVLTVLVAGSRELRIEQARETGVPESEAIQLIKQADTIAYRWSDFLMEKEAYDPKLYDLVIPFHQGGYKNISQEILSFYHKTSVLRSEDSLQAIKDTQIEVAARKALLAAGHNIRCRAKGGHLEIVVEKSVFAFDKLSEELKEICSQAAKTISVSKGPRYSDSIYRQQKFSLPSKVLFVDDEKEFVHTVSQRLIARDVGTYGVYGGEEALELLQEEQPNVMVLDLKMPGMGGVEVLQETKEKYPEIAVIILTGHGNSEDEQQCMELGAFAYLTKPVDIQELSSAIQAAHKSTLNNE